MTKTIFTKVVLSPGSMTDFAGIKERTLAGSKIGQAYSKMTFTSKWAGFGKLEAVSSTFRFEGVAIPSGTTHLFYMPYVNTVFKLDGNSLFLERQNKIPGLDARYFKFNGMTNYGEEDKYIVIYLKETGFTSIENATI